MRGVEQFQIPIPTQGLLKDRPTQTVPLGGILAGTNMMLDPDGYYRPRAGYSPWLASFPSEALYGMAFYVDTDGSYQYIGAGASNVWTADIAAKDWIAQGGNLHGDPDDLVSIIPFLQPWIDGATQAAMSAIVCNNNDPLVIWNRNLSGALPLTPVHQAGGGDALAFSTNPTFPASPYGAIYPSGPPGPSWFFTVNETNTYNVTLSINGLQPQPLRYVGPNGAIDELPPSYFFPGQVYNISYDGSEFLIGTNVVAPVARALCALNGRIVAVNVQSGAVRVPAQVTWSSVFDATSWPADAFQNLTDTDDPMIGIFKIGWNAAIVYGEKSGYLMQGVPGAGDASAFSFTPINGYVIGPVSPLAIVQYSGGNLFLGRDYRIWTTDGYGAQPFANAPNGAIQPTLNPQFQGRVFTLSDEPNRRKYWFFQQKNQNTSSALVLAQDPQPHFESIQTYATLFSAATPAIAEEGVTMDQLTNGMNAYTQPWNSFASEDEIIELTSDAGGQTPVYLFGEAGGNSDTTGSNPTVTSLIPYSYTPGLMHEGPVKDVRVESMDFFLQPMPDLAIPELLTAQFNLLKYPDDPGATVLQVAIDLRDPASFTQWQVYPGIKNYDQYLQMVVFGLSVTRALAFGGAQIYCNAQNRPSHAERPRAGVLTPES